MRRWLRGVLGAVALAAVFGLLLGGTALAGDWSLVSGPNINYRAVDFVDASHGWVAGATFTPGGEVGIEPTATIGRTDSAGLSWQYSTSHEAGEASQGWNFLAAAAVDFVDDLHGWAALSDGTIVATDTGGVRWELQAPGSFEFRDNNWSYSSLSMADSSHGVAVGSWVGFIGLTYPRIVYTADGREWKAAELPKLENGRLESVCMLDGQNGWAVGAAVPADKMPLVLVTHNGGATWARQTGGLSANGLNLHGVAFVDQERGWAVGDSGTVLVTVDGGATWWSRSPGASVLLTAVHFDSASVGWIAGEKGALLVTRDAGKTWTAESLPDVARSASVRALASAGGRAWAVGDGGVILTATVPPAEDTGTHFTDLDGSPYRIAVESLAAAGLLAGFPDGTFRPDTTVLRRQFAKMVVGALGIVPGASTATRFVDLGAPDADGYPHRYVQAAFDHGITTGVDAAQTLFAPWDPIRRDQVVSMIVRGAGSTLPGVFAEPPPGTVSLFAGVGEPHGENLRLAEHNGLLAGLAGLGPDWRPEALATRGEVAQMLYNLKARSR